MIVTVKATVRRMLIQYPSLFKDKGDCFSHLFLTIGNGYDWTDGCLVDRFSTDDEPRWADESGDPGPHERELSPEIDAMLRPQRIFHAKRENNQVRFVMENFEGIWNEPMMYLHDPYPACEYSALFNMPDDVQPDWLKACNDTSRALNMWLHNWSLSRSAEGMERMATMNRAFREKHFSDEDKRMRDMLAPLLRKQE